MNKKQLEAKKKYYDTFENSVDYIQEYKNVLSLEECEIMIDLFNELKKEGKGYAGRVTKSISQNFSSEDESSSYKNIESKESYDIFLNPFYSHDGKEDIGRIYKKINYFILDYLIKVGALNPNYIGMSFKEYSLFAQKNDIKLDEHSAKQYRIHSICLRKYPKKTGGYHSMHCDVNHNTVLRVAAGILYLNDIHEGGEPKFPVLGRKVKPKSGKMAFFPPYYTHMHYGEISENEDRYVLVIHVIHSNVEIKITEQENKWEEP